MQHTSASLTINENYDCDVRTDTETFLNRIVPEVSLLISHGALAAYLIQRRWATDFSIFFFFRGTLHHGDIHLKVSIGLSNKTLLSISWFVNYFGLSQFNPNCYL